MWSDFQESCFGGINFRNREFCIIIFIEKVIKSEYYKRKLLCLNINNHN